MYAWKDSEFDLLEVHNKVRERFAIDQVRSEPFQGCGLEAGIKVWRIEDFKLVELPEKEHGHFTSGDSYLVLNTYKPNPGAEELEYNTHFWVGEEASLDEYCAAAYKAVELFIELDCKPVQYRDIQGYESDEFKKCFNAIAHGPKPRLWEFTRTQKDVITQTQRELSWSSLHGSSVFVLETNDGIVQWNAPETNNFERHRAQVFVSFLKTDEPRLHSESIEETQEALTNELLLSVLGPISEDFAIATNKPRNKEVPCSPDYVKTLLRLTDEEEKKDDECETEPLISVEDGANEGQTEENEGQPEERVESEGNPGEGQAEENKKEQSGEGKAEDNEGVDDGEENPEEGKAVEEDAGNAEKGEAKAEENATEGEDTECGESKKGSTEGGESKEGNTEGGESKEGNTEGGHSKEGNTEGGESKEGNTEGGESKEGNTEEGKKEEGNKDESKEEEEVIAGLDDDSDDESLVMEKPPVVRVEVVAQGDDIKGSMLDVNDVFMLDDIKTCYVWLGTDATSYEKRKGFEYAHQYLKDKPHFMAPVVVINAGKETPAFKRAVGM